MTALTILIAIIIDRLAGEPRRFHPLVGFGQIARYLEDKLWTPGASRVRGIAALATLLLGLGLLVFFARSVIDSSHILTLIITSAVVYLAIAPRSLSEHAVAVRDALRGGDISLARERLSMIVSRDTGELDEQEIAAACCESVLENGSDGIFAALFWFSVFALAGAGDYSAGLYGIVWYRAVNTLDAMWGYKNARYLQFGWAAARLDDVLNYIPARLVGFSYALVGNYQAAMHCWHTQAAYWKSPNAGVVMAAGAGSLGIVLGGNSVYDGILESKPALGVGRAPGWLGISSALALVTRTLLLWVVTIALIDSFVSG